MKKIFFGFLACSIFFNMPVFGFGQLETDPSTTLNTLRKAEDGSSENSNNSSVHKKQKGKKGKKKIIVPPLVKDGESIQDDGDIILELDGGKQIDLREQEIGEEGSE